MDLTGIGALLLLYALFSLFFSAFRTFKKKRRLPPGPTPWLFLGNLFQKDVLPLASNYTKLAEKYGPIFTIWLGPRPAVVLYGYDVLKDAFLGHGEEFGGRPESKIKVPGRSGQGFGHASEKKWQAMRQFTLTTLRDFGMGKRRMSDRVQEEALCLVEEIAATQGKAFDISRIIIGAVSNVMCSVIFGSRFDYNDKAFLGQQRLAIDRINFYHTFSALVYVSMPKIMAYLPGTHKKILAEGQQIYDFIHERVKSHKQSLDPQNPRDFIDCFLIKLEKDQSNNEVIITEGDFIMVILGLFAAALGNTTRSFLYSLLVMAKFPHIQAKVQQEIAEMVGTHRPPNMEDRVNLPFTNAVVHEVQRYQKLCLETFPREMTCDTKFRGHTIPKGTTIIPLIVSSHFDPLQWETPEEFDPGHFLDEKGQFQKRDAFMPFSIGKRSCPAEALVQMEIFLFFSTMLQNFTFQLTEDARERDLSSLFMEIHSLFQPLPIEAIRCPK